MGTLTGQSRPHTERTVIMTEQIIDAILQMLEDEQIDEDIHAGLAEAGLL